MFDQSLAWLTLQATESEATKAKAPEACQGRIVLAKVRMPKGSTEVLLYLSNALNRTRCLAVCDPEVWSRKLVQYDDHGRIPMQIKDLDRHAASPTRHSIGAWASRVYVKCLTQNT